MSDTVIVDDQNAGIQLIRARDSWLSDGGKRPQPKSKLVQSHHAAGNGKVKRVQQQCQTQLGYTPFRMHTLFRTIAQIVLNEEDNGNSCTLGQL